MPGAADFIRAGLAHLDGDFDDPRAHVSLHGTSLFSLYRVATNGMVLGAKLMDDESMARTEARGLQALRATGARVPEVFGVYAEAGRVALYMEFVEAGSTLAAGAARNDLLNSLEALYRSGRERWGLEYDNFIGSLPQKNGQFDSFTEFWWEARIRPMAAEAVRRRHLTPAHQDRLREVVFTMSTRWNLDAAGPRLIHGDLWSGNVLAGKDGMFLIDPSVAASHPEQDFGMLLLFGSPLKLDDLESLGRKLGFAPGLAERIPFWQLYPLLVHVNIFGASYVSSVERELRAYE